MAFHPRTPSEKKYDKRHWPQKPKYKRNKALYGTAASPKSLQSPSMKCKGWRPIQTTRSRLKTICTDSWTTAILWISPISWWTYQYSASRPNKRKPMRLLKHSTCPAFRLRGALALPSKAWSKGDTRGGRPALPWVQSPRTWLDRRFQLQTEWINKFAIK